METWTDIQRPEAERKSEVIPTPWANLNRKLAGGLHAGRSYIIAARPGLGKSIWVSTFAPAPLGKGSAAWSTPWRCHVQSWGHGSLPTGRRPTMDRLFASGRQRQLGAGI